MYDPKDLVSRLSWTGISEVCIGFTSNRLRHQPGPAGIHARNPNPRSLPHNRRRAHFRFVIRASQNQQKDVSSDPVIARLTIGGLGFMIFTVGRRVAHDLDYSLLHVAASAAAAGLNDVSETKVPSGLHFLSV